MIATSHAKGRALGLGSAVMSRCDCRSSMSSRMHVIYSFASAASREDPVSGREMSVFASVATGRVRPEARFTSALHERSCDQLDVSLCYGVSKPSPQMSRVEIKVWYLGVGQREIWLLKGK